MLICVLYKYAENYISVTYILCINICTYTHVDVCLHIFNDCMSVWARMRVNPQAFK